MAMTSLAYAKMPESSEGKVSDGVNSGVLPSHGNLLFFSKGQAFLLSN